MAVSLMNSHLRGAVTLPFNRTRNVVILYTSLCIEHCIATEASMSIPFTQLNISPGPAEVFSPRT